MNPSSTLNLVLFLPLFGALVLAFLPKEQHTWFKVGALGVAIANLILSLSLLGEFQASTNGNYQFVT